MHSAARIGARTIGAPAKATRASAPIEAARRTSERIITTRRSWRSASTPPSGPSTTSGTMRAAVVIPTQTVEPVRSYTNASSARLYSQSPAWEMTRPLNRTRRSRWRSEMRNGRAGFSMRSPGWWEVRVPRNVGRSAAAPQGRSEVVALAVNHVEPPSCDEGGLLALAVPRVHVHLVAPWGRRRHGSEHASKTPRGTSGG